MCATRYNSSSVTLSVISVNPSIQENNSHSLLGHRSKAPDHAFILTEFDTGYYLKHTPR